MAALKFWREGLIAVALGLCFTLWTMIGNRNETINGLNQEITRITAINDTNGKWTTATTSVLTSVINEQNAGIDRVLTAVSESAAGIAASVDAKRAEDAKADAAIRTIINNLPKATSCEIMMENLIKSGGAIKW
ncbi:hypothetical protein D3C73_910900 [compost metagenome]